MDAISFDKLLFNTVFCCMAADGDIDKREISLIKSICDKSALLSNFNFQEEINKLVEKINTSGKDYIQYYFDLLKHTQLSEEEELTLIDFAIQTINADEKIEYSEIKFFKNIRHRLKVRDNKILERFPDIEQYLEDDIITDGFLDKISNQYFQAIELPQFDLITIETQSSDNSKKEK
ncbi:MAG: TerB family tellurite resistance protein [Sphingobacteriia bacterium]|nr:TerB family tellurite resistance protein [Sphingobacteriia bacterium]